MAAIKFSDIQTTLSAPDAWKAAAAGALGAFVGGMVGGAVLSPFFNSGLGAHPNLLELLWEQALLSMFSGAILSAGILAFDNQSSLRGQWHRDLWPGILLFVGVAFLSGGLGQLLYSMVGSTRAIPWALMGAGIGASIGLLRKDPLQTQRGAIGGAGGGALGGLLVDGFLQISYTDATFALASQLGFVITGAMIALMMRVVQEALGEAWLLGISSGPYEGKKYPLNTRRITVGQSELNDIGLYRETSLPPQLGAFELQNQQWQWHGMPIHLNGQFQDQAVLRNGDTLQLGSTQFRFGTRAFPTTQASFTAAPVEQISRWKLSSTAGATPDLLLAPGAPQSLGRAPNNALIIADDGVSSNHARFEISAQGLSVTDLGSTNGTWINGQRLRAQATCAVRAGDVLRLGRLEFTVARI